MATEPVRDYLEILDRIRSSLDGSGFLGSLGEISTHAGNYPINKIVLGQGNSKKVLISAGIHGDEPAGVETVCTFIENKHYRDYLEEWEITFLPCLNPFGYEHNSRNNHEDKDLNRLFKLKSPAREVTFSQSVLQSRFDLTLELHEDEDGDGYYLYQKMVSPLDGALGRLIIDRVQDIMPINTNSEIEGTPSDRGVIDRLKDPEEMEWWPMALYALSNGVRYCLTLETATCFPMETRVRAHITAITTALKNYPRMQF